MTKRDEFVKKMKTQLDELNVEIDKLEAKFAEANETTKVRLAPHLEKARKARTAVVEKLAELKDAGETSWDSMQAEAEHVWKTFKQSVNYFKSQL